MFKIWGVIFKDRCIFVISLFVSLWLCTDLSAQSNDNFEELQNISLDKCVKREKSRQVDVSHSLKDSLDVFDVDIDLTLGNISFDLSWGDPVDNPEIRDNRASNLFGPIRHRSDGTIRWHRGFDYYAPQGTKVRSVGEGTVSLVQKHPDFGNCVLVTHKRPRKTYYSFYAHLSAISVNYGEHIQKGTILGKSGKTGNAYNVGAHLHFEYRTSPKHSDRKQENPNAIVKTKFYSADPQNKYQYNVKVVKKKSNTMFE